ncbi:MAG: peptidase M14 [Planctomycetes bacterium]|nr:peptidase M14 [Planctomycetota bacterium]
MSSPYTSTLGFAAAALALLESGGVSRAPAEEPPAASPPRLRFDRFYTYDEATRALQALEKAHPRFLSLRSIGKSVEGRDLWLMTVANPATGPEERKAAMYIDANIHGNEVQGTEVCLYTIQHLVEGYERLPRVRELVDERVFYILPMVNPDGRAHWFEGPNTRHSSRSGKKPVDDDGDGLFDEDGLDDIDGDGEVLDMWIRDPHGTHKRSPDDPRLLVRVKPGEAGELVYLGPEGIDNDGDGRINEDGPGGYDMNRNWPADWQPQPHQHGAGDYPLSLPETRAIAELILAHPNIAGVQAYHNAGGLILRGPGDDALGEYPDPDVRVYDALGQTGEFVLPFYRYSVLWRDLYRVHGGFINWTYDELGIFSFTNELWNTGQYGARGREGLGGFDAESPERLRWDDLLELEHQFVELKPARHPLYGEVLLGGFRKTAGRTPPLFLLEELCHRNAMFTLYHAYEMPRVAFRSVEVERLAGEVSAVTVTLENSRSIPSRSAMAAR